MKKRNSKIPDKDSAKNQSGFTLVEVLVGITILTVGLLGVAKMQMSAIQGNFMSSSTSAALSLAEEKLEEIMVTNFGDGSLDDNVDKDLSSIVSGETDHEEQIQNAQGRFRRIWNITDHQDPGTSPATGLPTMKFVTVIVTWENNKHRVELSSIKMP